MWRRAVFPQVDALPGAQQQPTAAQRHGDGTAAQHAACMGGHVVVAFVVVAVGRVAVGRPALRQGFHIGAHGRIEDTELFQIKGAPYSLTDLLGDPAVVEQHRNGRFITLRLMSSMYHRFHAPHDCRIERVTFVHGGVWNVNPIALKRVERLFCRNERAVLQMRLASGEALTLVPVAAILVASLRLHFLDLTLNAQSRGPTVFPCDASVRKGDELGWFEHGSTIIMLAPDNFEFCDNVMDSARIKAGQPLMRRAGISKPT